MLCKYLGVLGKVAVSGEERERDTDECDRQSEKEQERDH